MRAGRALATAAIYPLVYGCAAHVAPANVCIYGPWEPPSPLTSQNAVLRNPSVALPGGSVIAVGNNVVSWSDTLVADSVFRAFTVAGPDLRPPELSNGLIRLDPRVLTLAREVFIIWAESERPLEVGRDWWFPNAQTIWTARKTAGEGWSSPKRVYESSRSDGIGIDLRNSGNLTVHEAGPYLTFLDGLNPSTLVQIALRREGRDTLFVGAGWHLSVASMGSAGLMAVYAGGDAESERSGIVYFTTRTTDGPWREAVQLPVRDRAEDEARDLAVVRQGHRMSVFWLNSTGVLHYWTPDHGSTWHRGEPLARAGASDLHVLEDDCGNAHVAYADFSDEANPTIVHAVLDPAGDWIEEGTLFPGFHAIQPGLAVDRDRVVLVASIKETFDDTGSTFRPMYVERRRANVAR